MAVRYEYKYLLTHSQFLLIHQAMKVLMQPDRHGMEGGYPVLSLYFDTLDHEYYDQKIQGEWIHIKVRYRRYTRDFSEPGGGFLELKVNRANRQAKERVYFSETPDFYDEGFWLQEAKEPFFREYCRGRLVPRCFVYYDRLAYHHEESGGDLLRITFDHGVSSFGVGEGFLERRLVYGPSLPAMVIMEIKYSKSDFPSWLQDLLRQFSLRRRHISKYAEGVDALQLQSIGAE